MVLNNELRSLEFKKPVQACFLGDEFVVSFAADNMGVYKDLVINTNGIHPTVKVIERKTKEERVYKRSNFDFFD